MSASTEKAALQAHRAFVQEHLPALRDALDLNQTVIAIGRALVKAEIPVNNDLLRIALTEAVGPVG